MNNEGASLLLNHLFVNFAVYSLFIMVYRYFLIRFENKMSHHSKVVGLLCSAAMVICMKSPVSIAPGYTFDFRHVGFILGSMLGGIAVSVWLGAVSIVFRFMVGGHGAYINAAVVPFTFAAVQLVRPYYWRMDERLRLLAVAGVSAFNSFAVYLGVCLDSSSNFRLGSYMEMSMLQMVTTVVVFYLINQIKRYLQWIEAISQAEKNRMVSQIAASISHEVRNPLTVIRGFVQLMSNRQFDPDKQRAYFDLIISEADRAVTIINDYLSLAKAHEEKASQEISVKAEVKYAMNVIGPYALLQGVELEGRLLSEGEIRIDAYKLRQALVNLMKNAIEAMPDGGTLTVVAEDGQDQVCITIQDTGCGMTEEQLKKVGTPFYSTKASGTGLGMMLVNHVVRSSGGSLSVRSKVGEGTDFRLEFPLVPAACGPARPYAPKSNLQ